MASNYPAALDTIPTNKLDVTGQGSGDHAGHHNTMADAINKIEAELGVNPSGSFATLVLRLAALQAISEKGQPSGYASLDSSGKIPQGQLPGAGIPSGAVMAFGGTGAPSGFLICDGSAVSRTTYADLFTAIGIVHGAGDGSTTFNLPDYRGRGLVGMGTHADVNAIGKNEGEILANRRPKHKHTVNDPGHTHTIPKFGGSGGTGLHGDSTIPDTAPSTNSATTGVSVGPQTTAPTDSMAYGVVNFIIKT